MYKLTAVINDNIMLSWWKIYSKLNVAYQCVTYISINKIKYLNHVIRYFSHIVVNLSHSR